MLVGRVGGFFFLAHLHSNIFDLRYYLSAPGQGSRFFCFFFPLLVVNSSRRMGKHSYPKYLGYLYILLVLYQVLSIPRSRYLVSSGSGPSLQSLGIWGPKDERADHSCTEKTHPSREDSAMSPDQRPGGHGDRIFAKDRVTRLTYGCGSHPHCFLHHSISSKYLCSHTRLVNPRQGGFGQEARGHELLAQAGGALR